MASRKKNSVGTLTTQTMLVLSMDAAEFVELIESMSDIKLPDDFVISITDESEGSEVAFTRKTQGIEIHGEGED